MRQYLVDLPDRRNGRPRRLWTDPIYRKRLVALVGTCTNQEIADLLGVSRPTIVRDLKTLKQSPAEKEAS